MVVATNRIESNVLSEIELHIGATSGLIAGNRLRTNLRYAIEITANANPNNGNVIVGNSLRAAPGALGCALDDNTTGPLNYWRSNSYSCNVPFTSPYSIPGAAGVADSSPVP